MKIPVRIGHAVKSAMCSNILFFPLRSFCSLLMDVIQNLLCMNLGLDLLWSEDLLNDAFFVDKIGSAEDADGLSAAGYLLAPAAEFLQ